MTAIAKKNPYRKPYKFKTTIMGINRRMYSWADNLFFNDLISASLLHTLKAIIATRHLKQPTIQQINDARTRSASLKFAQDEAVSNRTILRHIDKLEQLGYIKVTRTKTYKCTRNSYFINIPCQDLVKRSSDIVSPSLSCSSSKGGGASNTRSKTASTNKCDKVKPAGFAPFDGAQPPEPKLEQETEEQKELRRQKSREAVKNIQQSLKEQKHARKRN
jgi:hypothetical protein